MYDKNKFFYIKSENFKCAGGNIVLELIKVQTQIRPCREAEDFFLKSINVPALLFGTLEYVP